MRFMTYDLPLPPSSTRLMGMLLREMPRACSSTRLSVNRIGRSLLLSTACVCSTNMSISCGR